MITASSMTSVCAQFGMLLGPLHIQRLAQPISLASFRPLVRALPPGHPLGGRRRHLHAVVASAGQGSSPFVEVLSDALPGSSQLLSLKLDPEVRRRAEEAILKRGCRVTVGDVAAAGSLTLFQAEQALRALSADALAALQVDANGEILYVFDRNFKDTIRQKSALLRLEPVVARAGEVAAYVGRVAFGTALIISVVAVWTAIMVISSSKDERSDRRGGYSYGGTRMMFDLTDMMFYMDPFYFRRRAAMQAAASYGSPPAMNFLESIFSFVFGDGDPNAAYDKRRWEALGRYIQYRGGVVTAEELAPFLDVSPAQVAAAARRGGVTVDESYMLPALGRLGGTPEVDASGAILYRFSSLQSSGRAARTAPPAPAAMEATWELSSASPGQRAAAVALGLANLVGVLFLGSLLGTPANAYALARNGLTWITAAYPFLQLYAGSFFAIPAVRWLLNARRNAAISDRNATKEAAVAALQRPGPELQRKLASASQQAKRNVITERDVVFRSDKPLEEQPQDVAADSWSRRLERRASRREAEDEFAPSAPPAPPELDIPWQQEQQPQPQQQQRSGGGWW